MTLTSEISLEAVALNGVPFNRGEPLEVYERLLGPPTRSEMGGKPPPYGHRNNVIHYFDHLGLLLREHHSSYLIQGIDVVLEPSRWHFPTTSPYSGQLHVCGVKILAEMEFSDFARQSKVKFRPHLGHAWFVDGENLSIQFEVYYPTKKRKGDMGLVSAIAVGFVGAHRKHRVPANA